MNLSIIQNKNKCVRDVSYDNFFDTIKQLTFSSLNWGNRTDLHETMKTSTMAQS
jgi:hypothetical protein